jgi:hypothetical protein
VLDESGVADRCDVIAGDMLEGVPAGADAWLVKRVLMDWSNEQAGRILRNCAAAVSEHGKVLVVEMVLPPGNELSPSKAFDLLILLIHPGARVREPSSWICSRPRGCGSPGSFSEQHHRRRPSVACSDAAEPPAA